MTQLNEYVYNKVGDCETQKEHQDVVLSSNDISEVRNIFSRLNIGRDSKVFYQDVERYLRKFMDQKTIAQLFLEVSQGSDFLNFIQFKVFYEEFMRIMGFDEWTMNQYFYALHLYIRRIDTL